MRKKIDLFWYWFIFVVAFVLCFFAVNNKKICAYHVDESGNVVSDNLIDFDTIINTRNYHNTFTFDSENYSITQVSTGNYSYSVYTFENVTTIGETYTISFKGKSSDIVDPRRVGFGTNRTSPDSFEYGRFIMSLEDTLYNLTFTATSTDLCVSIYISTGYDSSGVVIEVSDLMLSIGDSYVPFEKFGTWYNEKFVGDLATGVISYSSSFVTYENTDDGNSYTLNDVSSYIDSSFGFLYFDRLWNYLDSITGSSYDNAWLTLTLNNKMNLNTTYILNAMYNNGNYGVGVKFYQGNNLILNVTNWINNDYAYCNETSGATCSVQLSRFVNVGDFPIEQNSFTYFDKIEIWSGDTDKRTGSFGFQNISYNQGYNSGYNIGYNNGSFNGENIGYNNGYGKGYLYGYDKGVEAVQGTDNTLVGMIGSILTAPVNMLQEIFNFEFLGINLTNFIFSVLSLFIVIWLIKIFL